MASNSMIISSATAVRAIREYNSGVYRGRRNVDIDRTAYELFGHGVPESEDELVELIRFVGDDYGGAQSRFLPHGYKTEAQLIVGNLRPVLTSWRRSVASAAALSAHAPGIATVSTLLKPFFGTKRWPVWASKTLHFFRPDSFPILDSRAKNALGVPNLGGEPKDYVRFCSAFYAALEANEKALVAAREVDEGASPSDIKLLDKILYQVGA